MKIVGIRTERRPVRLRRPFRTALRCVQTFEVVTVTLRAGDGVVGTAEVTGTPAITGETNGSIEAAINEILAPTIIGSDLADYVPLIEQLSAAMVGNTTAKCAVDVAVHQAVAAWRQVSLAELLGVRGRPVRTDVTVSLGDPAEMAKEASERAAEGFDTLKLKLGGPVALDVGRVQEVARALGGPASLRIDANQAWTVKEALQILERLAAAGIDVEWVEQPVAAGDLKALAAVTARSPVPVLADESVHTASDVYRLAEVGAGDLINLKLAKCGGLQAALELLGVARACGLGVRVGCMMESGQAVLPAMLLAERIGGDVAHDLDAGWWCDEEGGVGYEPPYVQSAGPGVPR